VEAFVALAAFAVLCVLVLSVGSQLVEPDDYAYRASIVAITQGHFLTLSTAQANRLAAGLPGPGGHPVAASPGGGPVAGVALFDDLVYGGPLTSGYRPGEITFSPGAVLPNLRYMPAHLIQAMPMLVPGLAALAWIAARRIRLRRADDERAAPAHRDLAVGLALAASWFSVWGLYAAYTWTANPFGSTLQVARFYVPAIGAISLLGSWLVTRLPRRASLAAVTCAAVAVAMFGLGAWSFAVIRQSPFRGVHTRRPGVVQQAAQGRPPAALPAITPETSRAKSSHRSAPESSPRAAGPT
jgi:hypothetical protein